MPLPILLIGVATVISGGLGAVGHSVAKDNNNEAQRIINDSQRLYNDKKSCLDDERHITLEELAFYGELKLKTNSGILKDYVDLTKKLTLIKQISVDKKNYIKKYRVDESDLVTKQNFNDIKLSSMNSAEIIAGGLTSVGTGALASIGTYGSVSMLNNRCLS
ncbi:hypothetical protein SAMN02745751_03576 [Dethiosulfatibacter aminovorans DSM 17477]|uniref:Uncharacterized protein n=1 Tax=Dethiosulfatibacter aminovorans DSM 17477 TaxID=1121476 RepID=A0A1M6MSV1_9FIRM|nr:hypothetical protein [Dethiosulfatibacter aminovorans]SHJ86492.1 hypothetical protein SAMN02745751_03576 [Dethiosulfatibacter aminovorans DSM 17477]